MNIVYYRYDYEYFTNILSLKMEVRDSSVSLYESVFSRLFGVGAIDRTNKLPRAINTIVLKPIPSFVEDIGTYEDIVKDNAKRIKTTLTLPVMMYYDGSIDATVALLGMIDEGVTDITRWLPWGHRALRGLWDARRAAGRSRTFPSRRGSSGAWGRRDG